MLNRKEEELEGRKEGDGSVIKAHNKLVAGFCVNRTFDFEKDNLWEVEFSHFSI